MTEDHVEGLGDVYCSYKKYKCGFGVVKAFEGSQQSGGGMEGTEAVLGRGEKKGRVERVSLRSWRGSKVKK